MIKETLINTRENFFVQAFLLLLPTLIFSSSLSLSIVLGGVSLISIYLMTIAYYFLIPFVKRPYNTPFIIGLGAIFSVLVSALSFYFYKSYFLTHSYLINIFFVSLFIWHKNIFRNRVAIVEIIKKDLPSSLGWIYLFLISFSFLKEFLGTGGISLFGFSFFLIPPQDTLSNLNGNLGNFIVFFLTLISLRLLPTYYPKNDDEETLRNLEKDRKNSESLLEKTKRLETLLNEGLSQK